MMPPLMTVGSRWPASSSAATIDVVVVLPCVPAMATVDFSRITSASIDARRTTGMRRSSDASTPGLPRRIDDRKSGVEGKSVSGSVDLGGVGNLKKKTEQKKHIKKKQ